MGLPLSEETCVPIAGPLPSGPVLSPGLLWACRGGIRLWISSVWLSRKAWVERGLGWPLPGWAWGSTPGSSDLRSNGLPLSRSSVLTRCCLELACSDATLSGFRRFRVRRRMICSPLFCLIMFSGLGVWKMKKEKELYYLRMIIVIWFAWGQGLIFPMLII